jgi:large subunit ribosomal protein L22
MDYRTEIKYIKTSPRKLREVADVVREQPLSKILVNLEFIEKRAAGVLKKAIKSAVSNAQNNHSVALDNLKLKVLEVNEGPRLKRWRPVSRGMAHPYQKKTSHIKIILTDNLSDRVIPNKAKFIERKSQKSKVKTTTQK